MKFGDTITITNRLIRKCGKAKWNDGYARQPKEWVTMDMPAVDAVFLGWRHLGNGYIEYGMGDDPATFILESTIKVALVCVNEKTNPFYTLL